MYMRSTGKLQDIRGAQSVFNLDITNKGIMCMINIYTEQAKKFIIFSFILFAKQLIISNEQ